jgi:hypothetical protein
MADARLPAMSARRTTRRAVAAAWMFVYSALALLLFSSAWRDPANRLIGGQRDTSYMTWFIRWYPFAVTHGRNPFLSTYLNYPDGINVLWSTGVPLVAWVLTPVTMLLSPIVAYNVMVTAGLGLTAWCGYLACRRWVRHELAAGAGGLLLGFSPYMVIQAAGHPSLIVAFSVPLLLILLDEIVVRQTWSVRRAGVLLGLLGAAQLMIGEEVLSTEVLTAAVGILILSALHRKEIRRRLPYVGRTFGLAGAIALVISAIPLYIQFFGPYYIRGVIQPRNVYVSDLYNFVLPTGLQYFTPDWVGPIIGKFTGNGSEWNAYLGLPLIALCVFTAIRHRRNAKVAFMALLGLAMAILSLGPSLHIDGTITKIHLPYLLVDRTPLFGNIIPSRLALYVFLAASVLLAVFVDEVLTKPRPFAVIGSVALTALIGASLFPRLPYLSYDTATPAFFRGSDVDRFQPGEVVLVAPYAMYPEADEAQRWQAEAGMRYRMPEGYFFTGDENHRPRLGGRPYPLATKLLSIELPQAIPNGGSSSSADYLTDIQNHDIGAIVVGPSPHSAEAIKFFTDLLGRPPEHLDGVDVWWSVK